MDNVIALPFANVANKEDTGLVARVLNALSGLPAEEQERIVRVFELMALSTEIELMERSNGPKGRR